LETIRQQIVELLTHVEMDAKELSKRLSVSEKDVLAHLSHIDKSMRNSNKRLSIHPSICLTCDFVFKDRQRFTRPGRCPRCKKSHITNPEYRIE